MKAISSVKLGQSVIGSASTLGQHVNLSFLLFHSKSVLDVVAIDMLVIAIDVISVPDISHYNPLFVCFAGYNAWSTQKRFESIANGTREDFIAVTLSLRVWVTSDPLPCPLVTWHCLFHPLRSEGRPRHSHSWFYFTRAFLRLSQVNYLSQTYVILY